jgi:hypothetical protein
LRNADWKKGNENSEFHIPNSEFSNALVSWPQACFFKGKRIAKVKQGDIGEFIIDENFKN